MKKIIHALTIIDKSTSMQKHRSRTIEGINTNIAALKKEVDENTKILNTQLQFSGNGHYWGDTKADERDFLFTKVGVPVQDISDMTEADYIPEGNTPLLDAIGYGIQKIKDFHGDDLGNVDLKIIVTVFTDGDENYSKKFTRTDIKTQIDHFQSDGKWVFTFVGCGSFENVSATSGMLGIASANTVAYDASDAESTRSSFQKIATSYTNYSRSVKSCVVDNDLFTEKANLVATKNP